MFSNKLTQLALAVGVGIGTGVYVFKPLLREYEQETQGTWVRPGDEEKLKKKSN
ncbi:hypothetical protein BDF21DRAFT_420095 [Thamnidium elegans]|uniref:Uncharacterized protein n=1 Tax=Thamnidium elegans TaxID=101142 RepID=A0A8H7SL50_9FUNG|nr:hypothetical protein INT48_008666 [Thamnidium elegans]KAI8079440.1 hypothetical protein BDF21DRAFT_420095 [Thamnidium elegans]